MICRKLVAFLLYKTKLKIRRRYYTIEKLLLRLHMGKVFFHNIYLIILVLNLLGATGAGIGIAQALQQVQITTENSHFAWQLYYFTLLLFGFISGWQITGRTLFPEDMEIITRVPLSQKQLSIFIFAEHLSSNILNVLFFFIIPIFPSLVLLSKIKFSGMMFLTTILIFFFAIILTFLFGLIMRQFRFIMLKQGSFWKTLLFQVIFVTTVSIVFYNLTLYFFEDLATWLQQTPVNTFKNNYEPDIIAEWVNMRLASFEELVHLVIPLFHYPYLPYNLCSKIIYEFNLVKLGLVTAQILAVLLPVVIILNRFKGYSLTDTVKIPTSNRIENFIYKALNRLRTAQPNVRILLSKNFLLTLRHLEIVQSNISSLFGNVAFTWIPLGFLCGLDKVFAGVWTNYYGAIAIMGTVFLLTFSQFGVYVNMRFLLSLDGEGRNIYLLRLAKVNLTDLYACQVRLLRGITLPAFVVFLLVLSLSSRFTFEHLVGVLFGAIFIYINAPKIFLLSAATSPHFEVMHFEESGEFWEQKISDNSYLIILIFAISFLVIPTVLVLSNIISFVIFLSTIFVYFGIVTVIINYIVKSVLTKLSFNIKQAESVL